LCLILPSLFVGLLGHGSRIVSDSTRGSFSIQDAVAQVVPLFALPRIFAGMLISFRWPMDCLTNSSDVSSKAASEAHETTALAGLAYSLLCGADADRRGQNGLG
jgi:hypothetical protein